jgi:hypothetical protein
MSEIAAQIGCRYQDLQTGAVFEVVAIDDNAQTIEAQLLDGALCEYDRDSWLELLLQPVEEPEDWRNAYELTQEDDPERPFRRDDWDSPLNRIEPDVINGLDDDPT